MKRLVKAITIGFIVGFSLFVQWVIPCQGQKDQNIPLVNDQSEKPKRHLEKKNPNEYPNHTNKDEVAEIEENLSAMDKRVIQLDKETKVLDKHKDDLIGRIEELEKNDNDPLIPIVTVIIALMGGIPGVITVINHFDKRPKFSFYLVSQIFGIMEKNNNEYAFTILTGTASNKGSEPLTPDHFELRVRVDGKWYSFQGMYIPQNVSYESDFQDIKLERAWERDLQKVSSPINQGVPLYGHLQFFSDQISRDQIWMSQEKITFEIMCKDIFGKEYKVKRKISPPAQVESLSNTTVSHLKHGVSITPKES